MVDTSPFAAASLESWLTPLVATVLLAAAVAIAAPTTGANTWFLLLPAIPALRDVRSRLARWRAGRSL